MATIDPKDAEWQAFHDWECGPGWDHYIGVKGHGSLDQAIATNLSEANAALIVSQHNQSLRSQAGVSEAVETQATLCSEWPIWLHEQVDAAMEISDRKDWSTEQVVAYGILSSMRPAPIEITEENVRAELGKMNAAGCLTTYTMADDRGLTVDEYVDLFMRIYATLSKAKSQQEGETE